MSEDAQQLPETIVRSTESTPHPQGGRKQAEEEAPTSVGLEEVRPAEQAVPSAKPQLEPVLVLCQLMIPRELEGKLMTLARAKNTTVEEVIFRSLKRTAKEAKDQPEVQSSQTNDNGHAEEKLELADSHLVSSIVVNARGSTVRLYHNHQRGVLAILFDEKPQEPVMDKLRAAGFRSLSENKVWGKAIDRSVTWQATAEAKRLFEDLGNQLRQDQGLIPITAITMKA